MILSYPSFSLIKRNNSAFRSSFWAQFSPMKDGIVGFDDVTGELALLGHQRDVLMLTATESESNPKTNLYFLKRNDSTSFVMKT